MMSSTRSFLAKVFSSRVVAGSLTSFDRPTGLLVVTCWVAAFAMLVVADVAVHKTSFARKGEAVTVAVEPVLPEVTTSAMSPDETQAVYNRLQSRFPRLKIGMDIGQRLEIKSNDGAQFQQWITALGAVETIAPQFHWSLYDFCVGQCGERGLMSAVLLGEKKGFSLREP